MQATTIWPKSVWPKSDWPKSVLAKVGHTTKTQKLAKVGLAKVGHQLALAKVGLAKVGHDRARFVGGRFSEETQTLLRLLAEAKTRSTPQPLRVPARQSWLLRWSSLLSCAAVRAFASSLLGLYGNLGADGDAPSV